MAITGATETQEIYHLRLYNLLRRRFCRRSECHCLVACQEQLAPAWT